MVAAEVRSANRSPCVSLMRFSISPPRAVDLFVEMAARHLSWLQRGHDEARVGLALGPFCLGDHAPPSAPALPGRPGQVLEAARRLARPSGLLLGLDQLDRDLLDEAIVAGEPEHVVDPVLLAPGH